MRNMFLFGTAISALLLMTACGKEQPQTEEPTTNKVTEKINHSKNEASNDTQKDQIQNIADKQQGEIVGLLQMPNPIRATTMEDIRQKMGLDFGLPEGAEDVRYSTIMNNTAQVDFTWGGAECTGRLQSSGETKLQDISGYYYQWENTETIDVGYNKAQVKWTRTEDGRDIGICIWWDAVPGIMYSVSMDNAATKEALAELANSFYIQMQGEAE